MRKLYYLVSATAIATMVAAFAAPASAQPYGSGMMGGWGSGMMGGWGYGGYGVLHMVFWVLILIAIIFGVVWLVRTVATSGTLGASARRSAGLDVLEERYSRGEINRDEYLQKKRDIAA
jgi:putative membrane protein